MNKFTFPLLIVITTICIYQFSKNKQNIKYINYMNEIIESKNLMINNLLKDDLYDINIARWSKSLKAIPVRIAG